jgi:hypothetical protein
MDGTTRRGFLAGCAAVGAVALPGEESLEQRLAPPPAEGTLTAVIDSDTYNEIDDQFAVAYALRSHERLAIEAVYAAPFHNERSKSAGDGMQKSYEEILRILGRLDVPSKGMAFEGSDRFMTGAGKPVASAAARDLIGKALKPRSGPLYVITVGAPTNVASAILMEPKIKDRLVVVWLGGQPYDWPTAREFNLQQDLHASRVLHDSGVALVNVPTRNVSEHLRTTVPEIERFLKGKLPIADYLCKEFAAYAKAVERDTERIREAAEGLRRLGIGGTAVGSGLNAHPEYHARMVRKLSELTGLKLYESDNLFESMQSMADAAGFSASLRTLALTLIRIANDFRLLASGPSTGLDEIHLPALQPGSSIRLSYIVTSPMLWRIASQTNMLP